MRYWCYSRDNVSDIYHFVNYYDDLDSVGIFAFSHGLVDGFEASDLVYGEYKDDNIMILDMEVLKKINGFW